MLSQFEPTSRQPRGTEEHFNYNKSMKTERGASGYPQVLRQISAIWSSEQPPLTFLGTSTKRPCSIHGPLITSSKISRSGIISMMARNIWWARHASNCQVCAQFSCRVCTPLFPTANPQSEDIRIPLNTWELASRSLTGMNSRASRKKPSLPLSATSNTCLVCECYLYSA